MPFRFSRMRASGGLAVAVPSLPILVAGTGSTSGQGFSDGAAEVGGGVFGTLSDTSAPGGRTIRALYFEAADQTYLVLAGNTHAAFLTGLQIWINGVGYTCGLGTTTGTVSFVNVAATQLFVTPNAYTVSFVAP